VHEKRCFNVWEITGLPLLYSSKPHHHSHTPSDSQTHQTDRSPVKTVRSLSLKQTPTTLSLSLSLSLWLSPTKTLSIWKRRNTSSEAILPPEELTNSLSRRSATQTRKSVSLSPLTTSSTSPTPTPLCPTVSSTM